MDPVNATSLPETILNATKIEIPTSCEQTITLTKMEIVDAQPEVDLENSNSQHLVETQYINLHRVSDLTKNLTGDAIPPELLSHHVVDLGSNPEFSQHVVTNAQFYDNADFLSQSFSDEDRRLALVAVQLIQNRTGSPSADNLGADLLHGKTTLPSVSSISGDKTVMSTIVSNYVQAVDPATSRHQDLGMHMVNHSQVTEQHIVKASGQQNDQIIKLYQPLLQQVRSEGNSSSLDRQKHSSVTSVHLKLFYELYLILFLKNVATNNGLPWARYLVHQDSDVYIGTTVRNLI